jgi:hypothetical protein
VTGLLNISTEDAEEYSQSLAQIGEGWWRQIAWAFRQGIPEALGMSRREWAVKYHGYFKLEVEERQEAVKELAAEGMNQPQIADALGVNQATVSRDLRDEPEPDMQMHSNSDESLVAPQVDELTPEPDMQMHSNGKESEVTPALVDEGDEWYTPRWLFNAFGITFSIDVCAPLDRTYSAVPAERHFTIEDDGLAQSWEGTVWCNPPYSKPEPWARRMIHHGDGLLLTHMPMNAGWCVDVWETCDAIRLFQAMEFVRPDGTSQRPGYWLQLAAFGPVATEALGRLQPLGDAAFNKRRVASPMWRRAS